MAKPWNAWAVTVGVLSIVQIVRAGPLLARLAAGRTMDRVAVETEAARDSVSIIVPVLNEVHRLGACLDGLLRQGPEVREIIVVDGGSSDGTQALVAGYARRDARVRLDDVAPVPAGWNGKAWGLERGLHASGASRWMLGIDADVRVAPQLTASLVAHAERRGLEALSIATEQDVTGPVYAALHAAMLTTLVYRMGPPGRVARRLAAVQANGQCFLATREALLAIDGFAPARASRCEDVTVARALVASGRAIGFYAADGLASVRMYDGACELWRNWPRSLVLRDRYDGGCIGLLDVALLQSLPLVILVTLVALPRSRTGLALVVNAVLFGLRIALTAATSQAYARRSAGLWLSPFVDVPVILALAASALRRRHVWRGRLLEPER
jgi:dolichol-phosphate mannosyltransferase